MKLGALPKMLFCSGCARPTRPLSLECTEPLSGVGIVLYFLSLCCVADRGQWIALAIVVHSVYWTELWLNCRTQVHLPVAGRSSTSLLAAGGFCPAVQ